MKIHTLGTGHGDASPYHLSSATLLEVDNRFYLIDCADGTEGMLIQRGVDAAQLTAVFVTHLHLDHTAGLPAIMKRRIKYRKHFPDTRTTYVLPDRNAFAILEQWIAINGYPDTGHLVFQDASDGYSDEVLEMIAYPNRHLASVKGNSFSFLFKAARKKLFFTGDLSPDFSDFSFDIADGCDLVICELTHFPLETALPILSKLRIGRLLFNHLGKVAQSEQGRKRILSQLEELPYPAEIASDGSVWEI
jgi:ribonuclease BN (tRNA processing enzyme)